MWPSASEAGLAGPGRLQRQGWAGQGPPPQMTKGRLQSHREDAARMRQASPPQPAAARGQGGLTRCLGQPLQQIRRLRPLWKRRCIPWVAPSPGRLPGEIGSLPPRSRHLHTVAAAA